VKYGESVFKVMATVLSRSAKLSNQWRIRWQVFKFFSFYPQAPEPENSENASFPVAKHRESNLSSRGLGRYA
jgi:hypothetical protein